MTLALDTCDFDCCTIPTIYDNGGVGDGNVTQTIQTPGGPVPACHGARPMTLRRRKGFGVGPGAENLIVSPRGRYSGCFVQ